jgi:hypothetical protein
MTAARRTREPAQEVEDPYRLGWRLVGRKGPTGKREVIYQPLTLEDWLYPEEEDFRVQSNAHVRDRLYLYAVFGLCCPGQLTLADHRVAWDDPTLRPNGPDVVVIPRAEPLPGKRPGTYRVGPHGARPVLVIAVTSPENADTRRTDLHRKRRIFYRAGVEFHVIVDEQPSRRRRTPELRRLQLIGYRRGRPGYERLTPDAQGRLWLEPVRLWLGIETGSEGDRAVCFDAQNRKIDDFPGMAQARQEAERAWQQAEQARQQAERDKQQADQARQQAERDKQQAERDKQQADQARQQAERDKQQANQARQQAEARVRELEAELRRLRGE